MMPTMQKEVSAAAATTRDRNSNDDKRAGKLARALRLDMPQGTAAIHPNTGVRKSWSVGCTQSGEHSSGAWFDGRELPSALENIRYEPVLDQGNPRDRDRGGLFLCFHNDELYADSEAVCSDDDDDLDEEEVDSPSKALYMRYCSHHKTKPGLLEDDLSLPRVQHVVVEKPDFRQHSGMSSPVDPLDVHDSLLLVQGQDYSD